jgi:signal transduction histidine kinase
MGSSGKIHQILMNLCTNAFHAMEKNGGILGVRVKDVIINKNFKIPDLELRYGEYIQIKAF